MLTRTPGIVLNKNGQREHPFLVPDLRGKAFSLLPFKMMLSVGFL